MDLKEGDHFEHNIQTDVRINYGGAGSGSNMRTKMDLACFFDVIKSAEDQKQVKLTFSRSRLHIDAGNSIRATTTDSIIDEANEMLVGKSVMLFLSKNNWIEDVKGARIFNSSNSNPAISKILRQLISKERIISLFGMRFNFYPGKPVAAGETWTRENTLKLGDLEMKVKIKYAITGLGYGTARISVTSTIYEKGKMANNDLPVTVKGSLNGAITINLETGYLKEEKYYTRLTAEIGDGILRIPMSIDEDYTIYGK